MVSTPGGGPAPLRGRDEETAALRRLIDGARRGAGGSVLVVGGLGTGKTALLDTAASHAARPAAPEPEAAPREAMTVATGVPEPAPVVLGVRGARSETHLDCAGLHALLRPLADLAPSLPAAHARVLGEALEVGTSGGGLALPAAVMGLLLAVGGPVVVRADDVQWLDTPSREALFFVARRAQGTPIALLLAADADGVAPPDIPRLPLRPLGEAASRQVVDDLAPAGLPEDVRAALARVSRGNPLALAELTGSLTPEQVNGRDEPPEIPPRDGRLWRAHTDRLSRLPRATADLVLLIAADPALDVTTLVKAVSEGALTVLEPAEREGIVVQRDDGRYDFPEPMMRQVIYAAASPARRRSAHRLLAVVLDEEHRRLRRAWHRAAALDGPPESLADDLVRLLPPAAGGGGFPEPHRALERAAELTAYPDAKAARLSAAAWHAWRAGLAPRARRLLARVDAPALGLEARGRAELVRGSLELRSGQTGSACDRLLAAAEWLLDRDREQAVRALARAGEASYLAGDNRRFLAIARRAASLGRADDSAPTRIALEYLAGMAATFRGRHREAAGSLRRVVDLASSVDSATMLVWAGVASLLLGDGAGALRLSSRGVEYARARGAVASMPQMLEVPIQAELWMGRYGAVAAGALEGLRLARETGAMTGVAQHLGWLALTSAVEGDEESCRIRAASAVELAGAHGLAVAEALGTLALAHLDVAANRHADAVNRLRAVARTGDPLVVRVMATPLLVESAARTGDVERARAALVMLDRWAESTGDPDRLALAARCHALLAEPRDAEERFREAFELHRKGSCAFEAARTQLLLGGVLRRSRRPGAAREHLHGALETFERYGARLWVEHARRELRAAGEAVPPSVTRSGAAGLLTAQQLQIARLVADGATNREVAARLFLSPRTVEHHLRNIFTRLGVRSRVELVRVLS
ncbi:LuxR C-terminal-related transcriptional regulator [Sphaerisporangium fuscum]|uniref:LuxR C-terminal-related transcriptional regulator n=1 Tax=Sphaerisporangium fuscum TaxID=2835868 RepID=UPI001BDD5AE8|nr:LuxR family transcriptional regulator [Sphaerisporangium fuscum]